MRPIPMKEAGFLESCGARANNRLIGIEAYIQTTTDPNWHTPRLQSDISESL